MSLVAVVKRSGDRPGQLPKTRVVPVGMPQDTRFGAYFQTPATMAAPSAPPSGMMTPSMVASAPMEAVSGHKTFSFGFLSLAKAAAAPRSSPPPPSAEDLLLAVASAMDSDGGMPGRTPEARASASVVALLAFLEHGHTPSSGAFRSHVARLVSFLESLAGLDTGKRRLVDLALAAARKGQAPAGHWGALAKGLAG